MTQVSLNNHFLIAMRDLQGDYFSESITYIIEHSDDGAFGMVINRPTELEFGELFSQVKDANRCMLPILDGGPVGRDNVFFLHSADKVYEQTQQISQEISLTTSMDIVYELVSANGPAKVLAMIGYAGWGAGQLENELAENIWLISPATSEIVFDTPFDLKPKTAAALLGIDLHLVSNSAGHG